MNIYAAEDLRAGMRARPCARGHERDWIKVASVDQPRKHRDSRWNTIVIGSGREFHCNGEDEWEVE